MTKRILVALILLTLITGHPAHAADAVEPATITVTNVRETASIAYANSTEYFRGESIRFTNCVMYAGSSATGAVQGLDTVTIEVRLGSTTTNDAFTGYAQVASNGTWWCDATVPTNMTEFYIQTKITDANTNSYIYQWQKAKTRTPLE